MKSETWRPGGKDDMQPKKNGTSDKEEEKGAESWPDCLLWKDFSGFNVKMKRNHALTQSGGLAGYHLAAKTHIVSNFAGCTAKINK